MFFWLRSTYESKEVVEVTMGLDKKKLLEHCVSNWHVWE